MIVEDPGTYGGYDREPEPEGTPPPRGTVRDNLGTPVTAAHDVPLIASAVYRTARKPWACECPGTRRRSCPHQDCAQRIAPGDRHVEYLAEAEPYQSGTRYCLPCGRAFWAEREWMGR